MALKHYNRVIFSSTTLGQGTLNVGTAYSNAYTSPSEAGASSGDTVDYLIEEGDDFEIGYGVLTSGSPWTMTRNVYISKIGGTVGTTKMDLGGNALVRLIHAANDIIKGPSASITDGRPVLWDGDNRTLKQHTSALGSTAAENIGTSGSNVPKLSGANTWGAPQIAGALAATHNTAWDGSLYQRLTVTVNGSNFTLASPSPVPSAGTFVAVTVTYSTTHSLSFGAVFSGMTGVTPSNASGKKDYFVFYSDGTNLFLVGYRLDFGA